MAKTSVAACVSVTVRELPAGLWHWQAPHPDWTPDEPWPREVSSYAIDDGARLLLFDPLAVPDELLELAADRESVVVLTAPWHERDTQRLVERLGTTVFAPPPDTAQDLMDKFGVTTEHAERLRPLLERPVEVVLPTHGAPTDRAALERALS
jgi:hypothetical protein